MRNAQRARTSLLLAGVTAACMAFHITAANATVVSGSSSSYGESVLLDITPLILGVTGSIDSGPLPTASGTAPAPYSQANSVLSATIGNLITTGVINAAASSNVDGSAGSRFAASSASVDQLGLSILNALGIGASVIESDAGVSGDYGALNAAGSTTIAGLALNSLPIVDLTPSPDLVLLNALGVTVTLNEQIASGDGIGSAGMAVNAIHIALDNVPYLWGLQASLLNGDIIIAHSEASLTAIPSQLGGGAVPEPATLTLLGGGLVGFFGLRKRSVAR